MIPTPHAPPLRGGAQRAAWCLLLQASSLCGLKAAWWPGGCPLPLCHHDGSLWFQDPEGWPVLQGTMVGEVGNGEMQVLVGLRTGAFALSIPGCWS